MLFVCNSSSIVICIEYLNSSQGILDNHIFLYLQYFVKEEDDNLVHIADHHVYLPPNTV